MILVIKKEYSGQPIIQALRYSCGGELVAFRGETLVVTAAAVSTLDSSFAYVIDRRYDFTSDVQLGSTKFQPKRTVPVGDLTIGGREIYVVAGPCSVENEAQIEAVANILVATGVKLLRAGAYKPRTSPYAFQGLGHEGLLRLRRVCDAHSLKLVTEARDATHIDAVIEYADIVQVGAKAMYDHGILRACARTEKPILLKRGFGSTIQEFLQAAEFILSGGNPNVILCERGIRTFENKTRFTLDLCGVAYIKEHSNLPIFADPSHAMGYRYGVPDLSRACVAMGVDGLLLEVHPEPSLAKSDAAQQLDFEQFAALHRSMIPIASAIGRSLT